MRPVLPALLLAAAACGTSTEPPLVVLPVSTAGAPGVATTDLGYELTVTRLRAGVAAVQMTIEGEAHAAARLAEPHPGHAGGGDVTGELPGEHVLTWDGAAHALGDASLIVGDYRGANWTWRAVRADELEPGDPLAGHTFHVAGVARKDGADHAFDALLDLDDGAELIGAVFEATITEAATAPLVIRMVATDPAEGDTAFDGVDFAALPAIDGLIPIRPGDAAHNRLRRTIQTHDHYLIETDN